jgi:hypothetical protein
VLVAALLFVFVLSLSSVYSSVNQQSYGCNNRVIPVPSLSLSKSSMFVNFNNLKSSALNARKNKEKILVLTPLKDAEPYLDRYFELLDRTTYPNKLISIAFLVSDSSDGTIESLQAHANQLQSRWTNRFESIRIFKKDFEFDLPNEQRHKYEMQPLRRSVMARSRNWLLTAAMKQDTAWVGWVDVDVVEYPTTIFEDLMRADADVVVPNCLLQREDNAFWAYDKNNWKETDRSMEVQKDLSEDFVLLEGYYEFPTYRDLVNIFLYIYKSCDTIVV